MECGAAMVEPELARVRIRRLGRVPYGDAMRLQDAVLSRVVASASAVGEVLVLEHDSVYTLGRGAAEEDLMGAPERLGISVHRVGRGGGATYHGPGQVVAYPIVRLPGAGTDVRGYVRRLERALIATCSRCGVQADSKSGEIGVWSSRGKIGAVGIGVKRGVAFHGVSLNVCNRLDYFETIVPCRMPGMAVTSLERESGAKLSVDGVGEMLIEDLCRELELCEAVGSR